ncbi:aminoglycoside phosphotransferase family protein [Aliiglaciecola sp. M165]|uniref:aminoglycoside phosphotransferase family protein n=1 Tax=Aliiglaciecola sp. M165 TaxID=2593649 RepID=UPI0011813180|nr:phosphotransferase [Aliiglaciecola sp. M165]TRY30600.1 phosphotransferase [Aliiglaciecola sp. M165]
MTQKRQREQALKQWINTSTPFRCISLQMVSGDASFRRYFRFDDEKSNNSIVAVDAPPKFEDSEKFVSIARAYKKQGVEVPGVLAHDADLGFYCIEDFGNGQFAQALSSTTMHNLYKQALSHLPAIQSCVSVDGQPLPNYGETLLEAEKTLFTHWLIERHLGLTLSEADRKMIETTYAFLSEVFVQQPQVGVHRDYHSRNLMILADDRLGIIDFQDAVVGPITYDAVSLLRDCYQDWPESSISALLQDFHHQYYPQHSWSDFERWFDLTGIQRHIKASGIFCRLWHRDGKSGYLNDIPHTLDYIVNVGYRYEETTSLATFVDQVIKPAMLSTLE